MLRFVFAGEKTLWFHMWSERGGWRLFFIANAYLTFPVNQNHANITPYNPHHPTHNSACTQPKPDTKGKLSNFPSSGMPVGGFVVMTPSASHTLGLECFNSSQLVSWTSVRLHVSVLQLELRTAQENQTLITERVSEHMQNKCLCFKIKVLHGKVQHYGQRKYMNL